MKNARRGGEHGSWSPRAMLKTFHGLRALRGGACLLVVIFHLGQWETLYGTHTPVLREYRWFAFAGVDLFFVLSGFVIAHSHWDQFGQPRLVTGYLFRRFWRLYPPFWAVMVITGVVGWMTLGWQPLNPGAPTSIRWYWLTLLPDEPTNAWVPPAWTLTYEMMFYLALAALVVLPRRRGWMVLAGWAVVAAAAAVCPVPTDPFLAAAVDPLVLEFLGGVVVAALLRRGWCRFGRPAIAAGVVYAVAVGALMAADTREYKDWEVVLSSHASRVLIFGPAAVLIVYGVVAAEIGGWTLGPRWMRVVGDASYSIYLWHGPVGPVAIAYGCYIPHSPPPHLGWLLATFAACVGGGFLFHYAVERPLLRLARVRKNPAAIVPAPARSSEITSPPSAALPR
ncbi:acyltransferase family protein [Fimbriiglobus ruber]|uniref:acyltransferase family protein n=1 Tax=Fimbriiglobus ruber TaxID=1908690 RepID=UPI00137A8304|nr:acyltransferase [Fimbriiglobus ruber]